jgi:hypothetical protein
MKMSLIVRRDDFVRLMVGTGYSIDGLNAIFDDIREREREAEAGFHYEFTPEAILDEYDEWDAPEDFERSYDYTLDEYDIIKAFPSGGFVCYKSYTESDRRKI